MDSIPYSEVRAHLAETLKQLEQRDEPVYISRRGQPAGVLMSVAQYDKLVKPGPQGFLASVQAWRETYAAELAAEAAAAETDDWKDPFDVRDRSLDGGRHPLFDDDMPDAGTGTGAAT
jgi:prevent-host-death family protein